MSTTHYQFKWNCENYKKILAYSVKTGLLLGSYFWDLVFFSVFLIGSLILLDLEGPFFSTYFIMGLLYLLIVGRRGLWSNHKLFSFAIIPCCIPAPLFFISMIPGFMPSNLLFLVEMIIWIIISQWPLFLSPSQDKISRWGIIKKVLVLSALQGLYGIGFQVAYPSLLEPLEWVGTGLALKPNDRYPSKTPIQFFYEDLEEADKIEEHLTEVVEILKSSPFCSNVEELVLVQKPRFYMPGLKQEQTTDAGGYYHAPKQYSYYFSEANSPFSLNKVYYSHKNPHRAVVLHELTHQIVSRYYGKWITAISVTLSKDEGYAEYLTATGCYCSKAELLAILKESSLLGEILQDPFSQKKSHAQYEFNDYIAAFIQTRYALDVKKISPLEFFKFSYKPVSAQEIKNWLTEMDTASRSMD